MADYVTRDAVITAALNAPVPFLDSNPCNCGCVYHENGSGVFILSGNCGAGNGFAKYDVAFTGNISIPTGGAVTPIATAIILSGEVQEGSRAIFTPAAVDEYGNVTSRATIRIPRGCCLAMSVEYVSGVVDDPATTPTPLIDIVSGSLKINKIS